MLISTVEKAAKKDTKKFIDKKAKELGVLFPLIIVYSFVLFLAYNMIWMNSFVPFFIVFEISM